MDFKLEKAKEAVLSLSRVRAVEEPPAEDGIKSVWHQGARGADLHSSVDRGGHATRQELTLLDDYFLWTSRHGVQTGFIEEDQGTIGMDPEQRLDRLQRAHLALQTYQGDDAYIRHVGAVIALAVGGSQDLEERTVTRAYGTGEFDLPPDPRPWTRLLLTAVVFALVGALAALAFSRT